MKRAMLEIEAREEMTEKEEQKQMKQDLKHAWQKVREGTKRGSGREAVRMWQDRRKVFRIRSCSILDLKTSAEQRRLLVVKFPRIGKTRWATRTNNEVTLTSSAIKR
jgi:hypothetical protein